MSEWKDTELGTIPSHWNFTNIGELIIQQIIEKPLDGNHGGIHPKGTDFVDSGVPFIMASDINNGKIDMVHCKFISKEQADSLNKGFANCGDVLLTHKATLGRTAIVPHIQTPYIMLTPQVTYYRIKNTDILSAQFLKYFFDSPNFQDTLMNHGDSGSTRAYVGITAQKALPICFPPLPEQKAIASVLSSLDDKIDLLHRQNKTLEGMAETLFRQWFIEEAEEDWKKVPLSSIATFLNGLACQKFPPKNQIEKLPVLKIRQLRNGFSNDCDWCTNNVDPKYIVENGDVIFSWSASLMVKIWDGFKCILNQHLFKVSSSKFPKWFYYLWSKHHLEEFVSISLSHATTMGHIKRKDLDNALVLVPSKKELASYSTILNPLISKIIVNNKQISISENLRNALLPKLMSGEVRVSYD